MMKLINTCCHVASGESIDLGTGNVFLFSLESSASELSYNLSRFCFDVHPRDKSFNLTVLRPFKYYFHPRIILGLESQTMKFSINFSELNTNVAENFTLSSSLVRPET